MNDPYPADLDAIDFVPNSQDPLVRAVNRLAAALEQNTLAILDNRPQQPAAPRLAALPPVQSVSVCPIHNAPWKTVPAGISKKTGKPYDAFQACSVSGCDQRPAR